MKKKLIIIKKKLIIKGVQTLDLNKIYKIRKYIHVNPIILKHKNNRLKTHKERQKQVANNVISQTNKIKLK